MSKAVFIAEKPSVAKEFAKALKFKMRSFDGYLESDEAVVTWCVGHLVTMSYPDAYDEKYRHWSLSTIPFIPTEFKYEVIGSVKKQFQIVKGLLTRDDVDKIYICTDSGREGEYIYRLVDQEAGVSGKERLRVWIDSQTEEEILRGIREAKDDSFYDHLGAAAYLRAKEDYLMGINFSRALTLKYGNSIKNYLKIKKCVISIGRVMTCVLGIVVDREREIRNFKKTSFYKIGGMADLENSSLDLLWHVSTESPYYQSPELYNDTGFKNREKAESFIASFGKLPLTGTVEKAEKKKEKKNAPLLYNLAELQNDCSRFFKISAEQTLNIAQELYEKKLTTYPRTDARVLSTAIAKVIRRNIEGVSGYAPCALYAKSILQHESFKGIAKSRYVNDKAITDHYAIIPTGQGLSALSSLSPTSAKVYECIVRRFLAIFFPPAIYQRVSLSLRLPNAESGANELFSASLRELQSKGYLHVMDYSFFKKKEEKTDTSLLEALMKLRKGSKIQVSSLQIKEGETAPPKRYSEGTLILTMENAGQFIEDEDLREQIKGSGIGTSATRGGIIEKLKKNGYLKTNKKTQIVTPTQMGEMIYETVFCSMKPMLNPALTASWEKGLTMVAEGAITEEEYMVKLDDFVRRRTNLVKTSDYQSLLRRRFDAVSRAYPQASHRKKSGSNSPADS